MPWKPSTQTARAEQRISALLAILLLLASVLLASMLLTGCAASGGPAPALEDAAALVVGVPAGAAADAAQAAALEYTRASGAAVRVETIPRTAYERRTGEVLTAGLSDYDLLYLPAAALKKYAGYHALLPFDAALLPQDEALRRWLPLLTLEGAIYGLPADADPLLLWRRADLLEEFDLPDPAQGWGAFRDYVLAANDPPERYGYFPARSAPAGGLDLAAFLHGYGARVVAESGTGRYKVALDSTEARAALEAFAALRSADGVMPPLQALSPLSDPARAEGEGRAPVIAALRQNEAALAFAPRSDGETLRDCAGKSPVCAGERPLLEPSAIPTADGASSGCTLIANLNAWVIPVRAQRAGDAARFAAWLVSPAGAAAATSPSTTAAVLEEGACFNLTFPPAPQPNLLWEALGKLAVDIMSGQDVNTARAAAEESLRDALRRQGMLDE